MMHKSLSELPASSRGYDSKLRRSKVERSWEEDLLGAIGSDDVHAVSHILTRGIGGKYSLLVPSDLHRSDSTSSKHNYNLDSTDIYRNGWLGYDINKLVLGMCVKEKKKAKSKVSVATQSAWRKEKKRESSREPNWDTDTGSKNATRRSRIEHYTFVSYGAPRAHFAARQWPNSATCLHVAVWANAPKVVKYLLSLGASSSRCDALGVTAYTRAKGVDMRRALRTPPLLYNLEVLDAQRGSCLLRWTAPVCDPPLERFRVRNLKRSGQSWEVGLCDVKIFARTREEPRSVLFQLPASSIQSQASCQFDVQPCNEQQVWGARSVPSSVVVMSHWLEDWDSETVDSWEYRIDGDEKKRRSPHVEGDPFVDEDDERDRQDDINDDEDNKVPLRLGMMAFGMISKEKYFAQIQKIQRNSATKIQARFRGMLDRDTFRVIKAAQKRVRRRFVAMCAIQSAWRGYAVRRKKKQAKQKDTHHRHGDHNKYRYERELLTVKDDDREWYARDRDKHRYKCQCKRAGKFGWK